MVNLGTESGKVIVKVARRACAWRAQGKHPPWVCIPAVPLAFVGQPPTSPPDPTGPVPDAYFSARAEASDTRRWWHRHLGVVLNHSLSAGEYSTGVSEDEEGDFRGKALLAPHRRGTSRCIFWFRFSSPYPRVMSATTLSCGTIVALE